MASPCHTLRYKNVLQTFEERFVCCSCVALSFTRYLSVTRTVMSINFLLIVLHMSGNRAVIVRFIRSKHRSREPRAAAGTTFITR